MKKKKKKNDGTFLCNDKMTNIYICIKNKMAVSTIKNNLERKIKSPLKNV